MKPGEEYTYVDNTIPKASKCYYYITAYNDEGSSAQAAGHTWVGLDIPENVGTQPILSIPSEGKVNLSWDAFGPANGGVIFPEDIVYNVYDIIVSDNRLSLGDLKGSVKGATSFTYDMATEEGPQRYLYQALEEPTLRALQALLLQHLYLWANRTVCLCVKIIQELISTIFGHIVAQTKTEIIILQ